MGSAISSREDFDAERLRRRARQTKDAARLGNVTFQIVRDWVLRFNAYGPDGPINGKAPRPKSRLDDTQRAARRLAHHHFHAQYLTEGESHDPDCRSVGANRQRRSCRSARQ
ncbi:helix-turn-helix domain-containing protein [Rhizobium leguminosarum]|uniref:Helix-turn-helix domain-containing protein n=2 Tax=Rhizobium TaxID=379 RepID=A0ACD5EGE9_9HYPH